MYQEFFKYMLNIDELNEDNYEYLTQLYGKSKLEEFFDKFVNEMIVSKKFDMIDKIEYYIKNRKLERFNTLNINKVDPNLSIYFNDIKNNFKYRQKCLYFLFTKNIKHATINMYS